MDSYLNKLDSQRAYATARQSLIAVRLSERTNRLTLFKALGGGWEEADAKVAAPREQRIAKTDE